MSANPCSTVIANCKRQLQVREAKKRQQERENQARLTRYQIRLPRQLAHKLRFGMHDPEFVAVLQQAIDEEIICISNYLNLLLLCWNCTSGFITAADAFGLYERNWRFNDETELCVSEKELIINLKDRYGGGLLNA